MTWRLIIVLLFAVCPTFAQTCHVVTPSGAGTRDGSTWSNAFAGLPGTLVRGDSYFLADGTYGSYDFTTPTSGTTLITIKKAISGDHCTDTGYNNATMGSSQAVFTPGSGFIWRFQNGSYWTIDGQSRTSLKAGHGIKLDNSGKNGPTQTYGINLSGSSSTHVNNITIRYVEIAGGGVGNSADSFSITAISRTSNVATVTYSASHAFLADSSTVVGSQIAVSGVADASFNTANARVTSATSTTASYSNSGPNASSSGGTIAGALNLSEFDYRFAGCVDRLTLEFSYIHDSSDTPVQGDGSQGLGCVPSNLLMQYTTLARNNSNSSRHSEGVALNDSNGASSIDPNGVDTWRYSIFEDLEGTGSLICIGKCNNQEIYGNVFLWHQNNPYFRSGTGNGIIATTSSSSTQGHWFVYNNTFVNTGSGQAGSSGVIFSTANCGTGGFGTCGATATASNNLCYFPLGTDCSFNSGAQITISHNWTFCSTTGACPNDTNIQTGSGSPLVDWVNENYHLVAATNAGNTLAPPYNTDPDGTIRGAGGVWNRGAFDIAAGCTPAVTGLSLNPTSVVGGNTSTGTVTLSCAGSGSSVALSSNNTAVATVPATVTVPSGQTTATFTISTSAVGSTQTPQISAILNGTIQATLTVTTATPDISALTLNPTSVVGGQQNSTGTATLTAAAPSGGTVVSLSSNNGVVTVPPTVTVPNGSISATFTCTTSSVGSPTSVTIQATVTASKTAILSVVPAIGAMMFGNTTIFGTTIVP